MINLFGSPAGRAINKITSIKLSKSEALKAKLSARDGKFEGYNGERMMATKAIPTQTSIAKSTATTTPTIAAASSSAAATASVTATAPFIASTKDHTSLQEDRENSIKAISGTVGIDEHTPCSTSSVSQFCSRFSRSHGSAASSLHTNDRLTTPKANHDKYMGLHTKKLKCWQQLENDKLNNNWNCAANNELKIERFDELIT